MAWVRQFAGPQSQCLVAGDSGAFLLGTELAAQLGALLSGQLAFAADWCCAVLRWHIAALQGFAQFGSALHRTLIRGRRGVASPGCHQQWKRTQQ